MSFGDGGGNFGSFLEAFEYPFYGAAKGASTSISERLCQYGIAIDYGRMLKIDCVEAYLHCAVK